MGDRALIHFHDGNEISPCIYLHWAGSEVRQLLKDTKHRMEGRDGDVSYTAARCIGIAHEKSAGNLSLGVWSTREGDGYEKAREKMIVKKPYDHDKSKLHYPYSHGDAGVFLVDCRTWEVETFGGYGLITTDEDYESDDAPRVYKVEEWDTDAP